MNVLLIRACLSVLTFLVLLPGCQDISSSDPGELATAVPPAPSIQAWPNEAVPGQSLILTVEGLSTAFDSASSLDFGSGIVLDSLDVESSWRLKAQLVVSEDATRGYRDLVVKDSAGTHRLENALLIQEGAFSIFPASAHRGESVQVSFEVEGVDLIPASTWADFGEGTTTRSFAVQGPSTAIAEVLIDGTTAPGVRDVALLNGNDRVQLSDAFVIDRELVSIRFEPAVVSQDDEDILFVVTGQGTHFEAGKTTIDLGVGVVVNEREDPTSMVVESPTRITGRLQVCRGAIPGLHDVSVRTQWEDGQSEEVGTDNALTVVEVPPTVAETYGYAYLSLNRSVTLGQLDESVSAYAVFQTRGDSCGEDDDLYPPSPAMDAGPYVNIVRSDGEVLRLDRELDSDGTFSYTPSNSIPLSFYAFDTHYSVEYPGGTGSESLEPGVLEDIIHTPSSAFSITQPDLSYAPTLNPYDSLEVSWADDEGQPGAGAGVLDRLVLYLTTSPPDDGDNGYISQTISEDTGYFIIPADRVANELTPGAGNMLLRNIRYGPPYYLPGSTIAVQSYAMVYYAGYFEMRQ